MDKGLRAQYVAFFKSSAGVDLINRLKTTEATRMMEGMKASTIEGKGISMAKMEQVYQLRTMCDDLANPSKIDSSQS